MKRPTGIAGTWRCFECGTTGKEHDRNSALKAFQAHWIRLHGEVPF